MIELRNGSGAEEREPMELGKRIGEVFVLRINLANPIHRLHLNSRFALSADRVRRNEDDVYLPSVALMPSQTAPTKPVTITVMTALKV